MKINKDLLDKMIKEDFVKKFRAEEEKIQKDKDIEMPEGFSESLRLKIDERIQTSEKVEAYAGLSEEDRRALELGRRMMEKEKDEEVRVRVVRKKRRLKAYLSLAAVLVFVIALGITSIGGPNRVVKLVKQTVGNREVEKVNSGEDNLTIEEENEEEAYQIISDEFGIEPVKIINGPKDMTFQALEFDKTLQLAEMIYKYRDELIIYIINASYTDTSWGIDVEDTKIDQYKIENSGCSITVKEYETPEIATRRYSASFKYKGLEYFLIGTMEKEQFEKIINNLYFF